MTMKKETEMQFDSKVYSSAAVMSAAYKYLDRIYCHLSFANGAGEVIVTKLKAREEMDQKAWDAILEEFHDEVTSQALRLKILDVTRDTRDRIMTLALYCVPSEGSARVTMQDAPQPDCAEEKMDEELDRILAKIKKKMSDAGDFEDDSMDIIVPWEEKYGDRDSEPPETKGLEDNTI